MMRRSPLKRLSEKKLAAHGGRVPRSTLSAQPVKRRKREPSEFARIYGSKARVEFVKARRCIVTRVGREATPFHRGPIENAHIESGGKGRKADADKIVPLCRGHHMALHESGRATFEAIYGLNLADEAAWVQAVWAANQGADRT